MRRLTQAAYGFGVWIALAAIVVGQSAAPVASGEQTLFSALDAIQRRVSISARIRHHSRLGDHTLMGSGTYLQRGTAEQRVSRWEMQTQVAGKTASYVQVFDGNYLWTDRGLPSGREVRRLEVGLLKSRLRTGMANRSASISRRAGEFGHRLDDVLGRGGLAEMIADLLQRYEFEPPRQVQLNGLGVHALIGHWRSEELVALGIKRGQQEDGEEASWPKQLPHHVLVLLGKGNLFPYVIEHRRFSDAHLLSTVAGLRPTRDPLVRYELFEVQFALALDPGMFQYKPGDVQWTDETSLVVERLRQQQSLLTEKKEQVSKRQDHEFSGNR